MIRPLTVVPYLGPLLATVIDPPLRVLVETGYDRTINPGAPTPAKYLYIPNPIHVAVNTLTAIPTGWDNGIAYITGDPANRPFHTTPPGPYGVGGPPVNTGAIDPYGPPTPVAPPAIPAPAASEPPDRAGTAEMLSAAADRGDTDEAGPAALEGVAGATEPGNRSDSTAKAATDATATAETKDLVRQSYSESSGADSPRSPSQRTGRGRGAA